MSALTVDDTYTGSVTPGHPQRRTLTDAGTTVATVIKMSVGPMDNNVYVVTCTRTGSSLLIDAANEAEKILELTATLPMPPELIVTTHAHHDHWFALQQVASTLAVPTAAGRFDAPEIGPTTDRLIDDGDELQIGDLTFTAIRLVGHTPGSIALALPVGDTTHLFTGDSLFPGGVGKTSSPADFATLLDDVEAKLFNTYRDNTVVYPGHGADTTLGEERPALGTWRDRGW